MRKAALSIAATAVLLMGTLALKAENYWQRAVVNYSRQQYRSGNQNWQVSQSWQGWMYFANNNLRDLQKKTGAPTPTAASLG